MFSQATKKQSIISITVKANTMFPDYISQE